MKNNEVTEGIAAHLYLKVFYTIWKMYGQFSADTNIYLINCNLFRQERSQRFMRAFEHVIVDRDTCTLAMLLVWFGQLSSR